MLGSRNLSRLAVVLLAVNGMLASWAPAEGIFLDLTGIAGESTVAGFEDTIDVTEVMLLTSRPASYGDSTTSPSVHGAMSITKGIDRATPLLAFACVSGEVVSSATLQVTRQFLTDEVSAKYEMRDLVVAEFFTTPSLTIAGALDETIKLSYGKIRWTYYLRDASGNLLETVSRGWAPATDAPWSVEAGRILEYLLGLRSFSPPEKAAADRNSDGKIDMADAILAFKKGL